MWKRLTKKPACLEAGVYSHEYFTRKTLLSPVIFWKPRVNKTYTTPGIWLFTASQKVISHWLHRPCVLLEFTYWCFDFFPAFLKCDASLTRLLFKLQEITCSSWIGTSPHINNTATQFTMTFKTHQAGWNIFCFIVVLMINTSSFPWNADGLILQNYN